ncbi:MAG: hypothetical protein GX491_05595 [Chloroflexi bacterium]|nr:hypothetical protein [Chloroflexota bacterium]
MPKYNEYLPRSTRRRERKAHPIWRGVGCLLMALGPVVAYAGADVLLKQNGENNWFPMPVDLIARPGHFIYQIIPDPMIYIKIILTIAFAFVFYVIFLLLTFFLNTAFGVTERNDPYYVPPMTRKPRRRR